MNVNSLNINNFYQTLNETDCTTTLAHCVTTHWCLQNLSRKAVQPSYSLLHTLSIISAIFQVDLGQPVPEWILLDLRMMEVVATTGAIRWAKLQSNHHHQQTNIQFFTGRMTFLSPTQQCQSTEGKNMIRLVVVAVCSISLIVLAKLSVVAKWLDRKIPLRKPNHGGEGIVSREHLACNFFGNWLFGQSTNH